jgi:hypothetical protein
MRGPLWLACDSVIGTGGMMNTLGDPLELLMDQQVRSYFLGILESNMANEQKYEKFIGFFETERQMREQVLAHASELMSDDKNDVDKVISQAGQQMGYWKPKQRLAEVEDSIRRAVRRLKKSQHLDVDKGWGFNWRVSDFWDTGHVVLCLNAAKTLEQFKSDADVERMLRDGLRWIEAKEHLGEWSAADLASRRQKSVYNISLAIRCFLQAGKDRVSAETSAAIEQCIASLVESQNEDGGWNAHVWDPPGIFSEVGATNAALQAFAATRDPRHTSAVVRAVNWLLATQNAEGSWKDDSCDYRTGARFKLKGVPAINKTCDALQGLLVAQDDFGIDLAPWQQAITKAVTWLQGKERPILDDDRKIQGWGWGGDKDRSSYEDTGLTLETLVRMPGDASLLLLSSNAQWLIKNQHPEDGGDEVGNWHLGHTARIALSLIQYYKILMESTVYGSIQ